MLLLGSTPRLHWPNVRQHLSHAVLVDTFVMLTTRHSMMLLLAACALLASPPSTAQVDVTITGDVATAVITLEDDDETYEATLRLFFQQPQNLSAACLGISADVLDAVEIGLIDARLPDPAGQEIDQDFPVRVTVEPPLGCGLSFVNEVRIELTTPNLSHQAFSPYRLMKGPINAPFADITSTIEAGSIRARGSGGRFSELLLVSDLSQDFSLDAGALLDDLANELDDPDIAATARSTLEAQLAVVESAFRSGQFSAAREALVQFDGDLRGFSGNGVANAYVANLGSSSEVGELLAISGALAFQLARLDGVP